MLFLFHVRAVLHFHNVISLTLKRMKHTDRRPVNFMHSELLFMHNKTSPANCPRKRNPIIGNTLIIHLSVLIRFSPRP